MTTEEFALTGVRLPRAHIAKLDKIAVSKRTSRNAVILWALDEYLGRIALPDCLPEKSPDHSDGHIDDQAA